MAKLKASISLELYMELHNALVSGMTELFSGDVVSRAAEKSSERIQFSPSGSCTKQSFRCPDPTSTNRTTTKKGSLTSGGKVSASSSSKLCKRKKF